MLYRKSRFVPYTSISDTLVAVLCSGTTYSRLYVPIWYKYFQVLMYEGGCTHVNCNRCT